MKMVMAVVPRKCVDEVLLTLINAGFTATYSETRGGMLRQSQMTLFIAVRTSELEKVLDIISAGCSGETVIHRGFGLAAVDEDSEPHFSNEGKKLGKSGAVVFIWTLDRFELP
ncbi:MAG: cyclic-di-AMP receptor [Anaerolineaceae bacterium]|nr:cyclic-di-AMP receptor [Anaerolineaceae bacterium]